jgi:hypothetical protein
MDWTQVVTHPLGLVAFVLALIFGVVGAKWKSHNRPWLLPAAIGVAVIAMLGGLFLAYMQIRHTSKTEIGERKVGPTLSEPKRQSSQDTKPPVSVRQETHGEGSPAVQGVTGNVTIQQGLEKDKK